MSLALHPGYGLPIRVGMRFDTNVCVPSMIHGGVFERHPGLKFIVSHTGSSFLGRIELLDYDFRLIQACREHTTQPPSVFARKNLYYDTCSFSKSFIEMAVSKIGEDRFLFGTDYPFVVSDASYVEALHLSGQQKAKILGGNATRLFGERLASHSHVRGGGVTS
jgi:aminocarboxymuconate-semialdehyde decarboxylase